MGLLDRVGIMDKMRSKASYLVCPMFRSILLITGLKLYVATLNDTGSNNMTCKTVQDVHKHWGLEWNRNEQQLPYVYLFLTQKFLY